MNLCDALLTTINEAAMKQTGKPLPGFKLVEKDGERPKIINKPPKMSAPMAKAKRNKAHRQAKAWAKASRKST